MKTHSVIRGLVFAGTVHLALGAGLGSCTSVYRRAEAQLPADIQDRLNSRILSARDAAAQGLRALEGPGDALAAERADWDLDKATASIGDVLERLTAADAEAESVHAAFRHARESLAMAVQSLESGTDSSTSPEAREAESALLAATDRADSYLWSRAQTAP